MSMLLLLLLLLLDSLLAVTGHSPVAPFLGSRHARVPLILRGRHQPLCAARVPPHGAAATAQALNGTPRHHIDARVAIAHHVERGWHALQCSLKCHRISGAVTIWQEGQGSRRLLWFGCCATCTQHAIAHHSKC